MGIDGSNGQQLIVPEINSRAADPLWSPDGTTLGFVWTQPAQDRELPWLQVGMICGWDRATGKGRVLAQGRSPIDSVEEFSWTADGKGVIVTLHLPVLDAKKTYVGDTISLARVSEPGGAPEPFLQNASSPMLSPDGKQLLFVQFDPQTYAMTGIMVGGPDGSAAKAVATEKQGFVGLVRPAWSPDSKRIVFAGSGGPIKGSTQAPMQGVIDWLLGTGVAEAHGVPADLWTVNADGNNLRRFTDKGYDDPRAVWSPDGKAIFFSAGGAGGVYRRELDSKQERQLSKEGDYGGIAITR
ncbi:MAG: hypothetical protein NVS2B7_24150 [Herpetosiphon sp.]